VFEVRAMVESAMVRQLCAQITDAHVGATPAHLRTSKKPSGALMFRPHAVAGRLFVLLARLLGNEVLAQLLADLLSRS
jgi:DNA-binding GntR family transcriptional regulator